MGEIEQIDQRLDVTTHTWRDSDHGVYRRLVMRRGRLVGAISVGDWPEVNRIQQGVRDRSFLWPWHRWRFRRTGRLYPVSDPKSAAMWPAAATVCNCTGVTRGQLGEAMRLGASTVELLMRETNASTVCGTCRPLLHEILGTAPVQEPVFGARTIAVTSLLAALAALAALLLPSWPYSPSVEAGEGLDRFWLDDTWKQISGFTLLGLAAVIAFLSVRKRIKWRRLGDYRLWRIVHTVTGVAGLAVLFMHTGFNLGQNLNRWLMLTFLAVAIGGGLTGLVTAGDHAVAAKGIRSPRVALVWVHILTFWPMPILLLLHIVTVYAY